VLDTRVSRSSFRILGSYIPGDWIEIEACFVGCVGLPSRETREVFGDSVPVVGFALIFFPSIFGEVEDTRAGTAPARLLPSRKGGALIEGLISIGLLVVLRIIELLTTRLN